MFQSQLYWMVFHSCSHFGWYLEFEFATACFLWHPRLESDYTWAALKEYSVNLYSQGTLDWHLSPRKLWIMYVLCAHLEESLLSLPSPCVAVLVQNLCFKLQQNTAGAVNYTEMSQWQVARAAADLLFASCKMLRCAASMLCQKCCSVFQ